LTALFFGKFCYDRNQLWGEPEKLLELAAAQSAHNPRPLLNFTEILILHDRCALAVPYLQRAERRLPDNYYVHAAWGRALACLGRYPEAMDRLRRAARIHPCAQIYEWMGLLYGQMGLPEESKRALQSALELEPDSGTAHGSLALWYEKVKDFTAAEQEYRRAIALNRSDAWAQIGLMRVQHARTGSP
jgi:tetratricopeptide (TPR) repeat protein